MTKEELLEKYGVITEGFPKEMMCWDGDNDDKRKYLVLYMMPQEEYPYMCSGGTIWKHAEDIETPIRKIEDGVQKGDIIKNDNHDRKVLCVYVDIVFLSMPYDFNIYSNRLYTLKELVGYGYKLKTENND